MKPTLLTNNASARCRAPSEPIALPYKFKLFNDYNAQSPNMIDCYRISLT